jgi:hypothetical protein
MDFKETVFGGVEWIDLAHNRAQWRAAVSVMTSTKRSQMH